MTFRSAPVAVAGGVADRSPTGYKFAVFSSKRHNPANRNETKSKLDLKAMTQNCPQDAYVSI
jgi:hypothetical protein